jgi:hypothetical protein
MKADKAFRTFIRIYSLPKNKQLGANIKLTLHKALIQSVTTYACPAWQFPADTHLLKLQHLNNNVPLTIGYLSRCTSTRELHVAFKITYVYYFITKLSKKQAEVIRNHDNESVRHIGRGEAQHKEYKRLKLGGCQTHDHSSV